MSIAHQEADPTGLRLIIMSDVVVTNRDGEAVDRGPHIRVHGDQGEFLLTNWTGLDQVDALPDLLVKELRLTPASPE